MVRMSDHAEIRLGEWEGNFRRFLMRSFFLSDRWELYFVSANYSGVNPSACETASSSSDLSEEEDMADEVAVAAPGTSAAAAGVAEGEQQQQNGFSVFGMLKGLLIRGVIFYIIANFFRRPAPQTGDNPSSVGLKPASNLFQNGTMMDLFVAFGLMYIFNSEVLDRIPFILVGPSSAKADICGKSPDPSTTKLYSRRYTVGKTHRLNKFKRKKHVMTQNLLTGQTAASADETRYAQNPKGEIV
ncbi:unnamed protein product, partial [Notodromas monacha]